MTIPGQNAGNSQPNAELDAFLAAIRQHESGGNYTAYNAGGGASGAYQYIQSTWSSWATRAGYGQYANEPASSAPPSVQDAVAAFNAQALYQQYGNWQYAAEAWYYPAWAGDSSHQDSVPYPSAGNTLTIGQYGSDIVNSMNQILQSGGASAVPNETGGGQIGSAQAPAGGATQPSGPALSMSDVPAVQDYIRQNYGSDSWLLDIPSVASVLEQAVVNGDSTQQIQALIAQTDWWKTTSQAVKNYEQNKANNPADYSFTNPGSTASQTLAGVMAAAGKVGVQLDPTTAQQIAENALQFGWNDAQIQQAVGSRVQYSGKGMGNAGGIIQQLQAAAGAYYMSPSAQALQSWAQNIAAGTQTFAQFQAQMQNDAALKWTGFSQQLQQGNTMVQLTDNLRNEAAKTMEVDPSAINFVTDPVYSKILDYVPPDSPNGVHRVMTNSEMNQYLKSQPAWGYTQQARDQESQLEQTLTQTWGKVA